MVNDVAKSAAAVKYRYHVIPRDSRWVVRRNGAKRVSGLYDTLETAIQSAKALASKEAKGYVVVHDNMGNVKSIIRELRDEHAGTLPTNSPKPIIIKVDKTLDKYLDMGLFQDKVDKANEVVKTIGLPKFSS